MSPGAERKTRLWKLVSSLAAVFGISVLLGGQALAIIRYTDFNADGGDVASGGWFNNHASQSKQPCNLTGFYQAPNWGAATPNYAPGGIYAFAAKDTPRVGSHGKYAAYSTGLIDYSLANHFGFYTAPGAVGQALNPLSFANFYATSPTGITFDNTANGGLIEGGTVGNSWHCIPDYFSDDLGSSAVDLSATVNKNTINLSTVLVAPNGTQYKDAPPYGTGGAAAGSPGIVTITAAVGGLAPSWNHTLFITGNVFINSNIIYAAHDVTTVPKFALVVRGNIWVASGVTRLDGIYVAQPDPAVANPTDPATPTGQFWSCQNNTGAWNDTTPAGLTSLSTNCQAGALTVNGSVTAAKVYLTRLNGGLSPGGSSFIDGGAGEIFNYTPEAVIGGSFTPGGNSSTAPRIDSIVSLPPVF